MGVPPTFDVETGAFRRYGTFALTQDGVALLNTLGILGDIVVWVGLVGGPTKNFLEATSKLFWKKLDMSILYTYGCFQK